MKSAKCNLLLLFLLATFWLFSDGCFAKNPGSANDASYAEVATDTSVITGNVDGDYVLYFFSGQLTWLSFIAHHSFAEPDSHLVCWPERSQLSTRINIILYQHYLTSPGFLLNNALKQLATATSC